MDKLAPSAIKATREAARLSQAEAAALVGATRRTWQNWESPEGSGNHRAMDPDAWALFQPMALRAVEAFERCTSPAAILATLAVLALELGEGEGSAGLVE